ncbi:MAG: zinc-finger domain-containing protein [Terricaulis sp.]
MTESASTSPAPEIITVTSRRVKCDGGGGALGHPVVYYDIGEKDYVECGYCDRRFVLADGAGGH